MAIKLADTLAPMADFPAAMAEHVEFADGENLQQKLDDGTLGGGGSGIVDDKIDTSSTNPVQNKVLAQEIARAENGKQYLKITGPMPRGLDYLYERTIRDAIENGSALDYQGVDIETVETNIKDNFYDILYRYDNAGSKKYTATEGLSLDIVPQDTCIIFEAEGASSGIDKYEVILEWFEPPFVTIYSSEKELDPAVEDDENYNFYNLTNLEGHLTSIFNGMKIKSELNIKNHNFYFDLNKDGDEETLKVNSYKLQKDFAGNGFLTIELEDGRILTSTRTKRYNASWSDWSIKEPEKTQKTYTTLDELGLTAPVTVGDIFNSMSDNTMAMIACEDITVHITDVPTSYGLLTIKKTTNSRFSIEYQNSLGGSATNVRRWIGTLKGTDGSGLYWKEIQTEIGVVITSDTITKYGTEILKYPIGTWRIDSVNIGSQFTDLPYTEMAGIIEIDSIQPNKSPYEHVYGYRNYTFRDALTNLVYTRSLNSGNTIGTIQRDSGWCTAGSHFYKLSQMYLTVNATIQDVIDKLPIGGTAVLRTDEFANWSTLFSGIQWGYLKVEKTVNGLSNIELQEVVTPNRRYFGTQSGGKFDKWQKPIDQFHRAVAQATAGYFKFKPTNDGGFDQGLRISVTDNYGGMINISGAKPSSSQYKPFKCIRLSNGEYTNYDAIKLANNKMLKLFYYDGYFYLKVATYTTCTFTGLLEAPTYIETFDETDAEEIPIRSVFDTPYNDGYADPSIIAIGDTDSSDGVIKTLSTLGFTGDIMTWDTGVYRISHVAGLTNLPAEITEEKPGLRLEHYDMKKWGSNHNPYASTYGCRQSVLHYKGDIYVRYTESGATPGVLIADTGWQSISNKKPIKFNSNTFKIDITKGSENWNGNIKFGYCVDESYGEIIISSLGKTEVMWDHSTGVRYVKSVTYTIDPNNKAHVTIGIELYNVSYGIHQLEIIGDFARLNSITGDAFTGTSVAKRGATRGRNNGVGILCEVADLGLTTPCTTIQIAQAMRNLTNSMNRIPTSGMIGIFDNGGNTITDAPSQYGLLTINAYGYDRMMIRYDGIASSTYAGSWIGKIKGSSGTFSGITWERIDNNNNDTASWTTITANSSSGYAVSPGYSANYIVKNNVVYINTNIKCNTVKDSGYDTFITGLPASNANVLMFFTLQPDSPGHNPIIAQIDSNGNLKLRNGTSGKTYMLSLSYPIM